jgi:hypothetical protein
LCRDFFPTRNLLIPDLCTIYQNEAKRAGIQGEVQLGLIVIKSGEVGEQGTRRWLVLAIEAVRQ